jgi:hypothetical protein
VTPHVKFRAQLVWFESAKRPSRYKSEQQKGYGRADQQDRDRKQVTGAVESAPDSIKNQIDDPPHDPCGGQQQPDTKQSASPIYLRNRVGLFVGLAARNSKAMRHDCSITSYFGRF